MQCRNKIKQLQHELLKLNGAKDNKNVNNSLNNNGGINSLVIRPSTLQDVYSNILSYDISRSQIDDVIWEINDKLDGNITWEEYNKSYERCKNDMSGLEPTDFYYLVCFLMYDKDLEGKISVDEQVMHMLYMKYGMARMQSEIDATFKDGKTTSVSYNKVSTLCLNTCFYVAVVLRRDEYKTRRIGRCE